MTTKDILISTAVCTALILTTAIGAKAETAKNKASVQVVKDFFTAFGKGDIEGVINSFHEKTEITAARKGSHTETPIYGSYSGQTGAREFIANIGKTFDTKAFNVDSVIGDKNVVFASGSFTHIVRTSGKTYSSDWALKCIIKDGKIAEYHFYEDSANFERAQK